MQAEFLLSREQNGRLEAGDTPNRNYRFHFHSHIEICVVTEGELEVWINDQRRVLGEGEISVAWSYDAHSYRTVGSSRSLWIVIPPDFFGDIIPVLGERQARESFLNDPFLFEKINVNGTEYEVMFNSYFVSEEKPLSLVIGDTELRIGPLEYK